MNRRGGWSRGVERSTQSARVLQSFTAANVSSLVTGLTTLPGWMTITCATTGRTSQTSASTIVAGLGANAARARNAGSGTGLSVENAMTSTARNSNAYGSWTASSAPVVTSDAAASPDGTTIADELDATGGSIYLSNDVTGAVHNWNIWAKQSGGACTLNVIT